MEEYKKKKLYQIVDTNLKEYDRKMVTTMQYHAKL